MGTWGSGPFENDGAGDLLAALRAGNFGIEDFSGYLDEDYLEVDDAQAATAIAACGLRTITSRGSTPSRSPRR